MLLSDLSFFSSDILKEKAKVRDNVGTFISNLSDFSGKSKSAKWFFVLFLFWVRFFCLFEGVCAHVSAGAPRVQRGHQVCWSDRRLSAAQCGC